jgi:hypothetical protein
MEEFVVETPLEPLKFPVYFIIKDAHLWKDLMVDQVPPPIESMYERMMADCWTVQTYVQLKRRGLNVHLVDQFLKDQICVVGYDNLSIRDFPYDSYVVCARHDRARPEICDRRIVQNRLNVVENTDHYIDHWPQPCLIPRNKNRGSRVENLEYKGLEIYMAEPFKQIAFKKRLETLEIKFDLFEGDPSESIQYWRDYSKCDALIAIRNCTQYDLTLKPASKLVNAWRAGCPALLGPEPAYQVLRKSDLDFFEVKTEDDVINVLRKLQEDPTLYNSVVENGLKRAEAFTSDAVAKEWREVLAGPIAEGFESWKKESVFQRLPRYVLRSILHKIEKRKFVNGIFHGDRLFQA